jgi:hypothetical protein
MDVHTDTPGQTYSESSPFYYLRDNVIGFRPAPTAAVANGALIYYQRRIPSLKNEGDEIPYILRDFKHLYKAYALSTALRADDKRKSLDYKADFQNGRKEMTNILAGRDESTNRGVEDVQNLEALD